MLLKNKNLRINYHVEFIADEERWNKFVKATEDLSAPYSDAPWELYECKDFDNIEDALEFYMIRYVDDNCYEIHMTEEIYDGDELICEQYIEPKSTTKSCMRMYLYRDTYNRLCSAERKNQELEKSNELMNGFIKQMGKQFEEMFKQYVKECER